MEDIKTYEISLNTEEDGVYAYALVADPAHESEFIMMSMEDEKEILRFSSDEKRIMMGPLLIAGKAVPRINKKTGQRYNLLFSAENIKQIMVRMAKTGALQKVKFTHHGNVIDGVVTHEVWQVGENDKIHQYYSKEEVPVGSLAISNFVERPEDWAALKASGVKGFSIEAISGLKEIMMSIEDKTDDSELTKNRAIEIIDSNISEEAKIAKLEELLGIK